MLGQFSISTICKHTNSGKYSHTYFFKSNMHWGRETHVNRNITDKFALSDAGLELSTVESFVWHHRQQVASHSVFAIRHRDRNEIPNQLPDSIDRSEVFEFELGSGTGDYTFFISDIHWLRETHKSHTLTCLCCQRWQSNSCSITDIPHHI